LRTKNIDYNSLLAQYPLEVEAEKLKAVLIENDIPTKIRRKYVLLKYFDKEAKYRKVYRVYVDSIELSQAKEVYNDYIENDSSSYYLESLKKEELIDIVLNPHIWDEYDIDYSRNILLSRKQMTKEIEVYFESKIKRLANKEYFNIILIVVFIYVSFLLLFLAPGFSIFGVFLGIQLLLGKLKVRKENIERVKKLYLPFHGVILIIVSITHFVLEIWGIFNG